MCEVIDIICNHFGIEPEDLKKKRRAYPLPKARAIITAILYNRGNGVRQDEICKLIGLSHSATNRALQRYQREMDIPQHTEINRNAKVIIDILIK